LVILYSIWLLKANYAHHNLCELICAESHKAQKLISMSLRFSSASPTTICLVVGHVILILFFAQQSGASSPGFRGGSVHRSDDVSSVVADTQGRSLAGRIPNEEFSRGRTDEADDEQAFANARTGTARGDWDTNSKEHEYEEVGQIVSSPAPSPAIVTQTPTSATTLASFSSWSPSMLPSESSQRPSAATRTESDPRTEVAETQTGSPVTEQPSIAPTTKPSNSPSLSTTSSVTEMPTGQPSAPREENNINDPLAGTFEARTGEDLTGEPTAGPTQSLTTMQPTSPGPIIIKELTDAPASEPSEGVPSSSPTPASTDLSINAAPSEDLDQSFASIETSGGALSATHLLAISVFLPLLLCSVIDTCL